MSRRCDIGLADLLCIQAECSTATAAFWQEQLGLCFMPPAGTPEAMRGEGTLAPIAPPPSPPKKHTSSTPPPCESLSVSPEETEDLAEIPFLRVIHRFHKDLNEKKRQEVESASDKHLPKTGEPYRPVGVKRRKRIAACVPWSVLLPRVQAALQNTRESHRLDLKRLSTLFARGCVSRHLPHMTNRTLAQRCVILCDSGAQVRPMQPECLQIKRGLERLLGPAHVKYQRCSRGVAELVDKLTSELGDVELHSSKNVGVLVLSDVAQKSDSVDLLPSWRRLAALARRSSIPVRVLSPRIPSPELHQRIPASLRWKLLPLCKQSAMAYTTTNLDSSPLALAAHCRHIGPGLLRELCRLSLDSGTGLPAELAAWQDLADEGGYSLRVLREEHRKTFREAFQNLSPERQVAALECLRHWRVGEPLEFWYAELLSCAADNPKLFTRPATGEPVHWLHEELALAFDQLRDLDKRLEKDKDDSEGLMQDWSEAISEDIGPRADKTKLFSAEDLARIWCRTHQGPLPDWIDPAMIPEDLANEDEVTHEYYAVVTNSEGDEHLLLASDAQYENVLPRVMLAESVLSRNRVLVCRETDSGRVIRENQVRMEFRFSGDPIEELTSPDWNWKLKIRSDLSHLQIDRFNPSSIFPHTSKNKRSIRTGFGRDTYGLFMELHICRPVTRLRWIPAGEFWMGSPEDEEGRSDWEGPRHRVRITRGFWLGETPVTQAEYQTLLATNPSRFCDQADSAQRPVERVSWFDTLACCNALSERCGFEAGYMLPGNPESSDAQKRARVTNGQAFRLPTEAEWEYACRAGSDEPRYGELKEIAWGRHNAEDTTHPVAELKPNAWGLYDTLGNVWERCWDAIEGVEYKRRVEAASSEPVLDPVQDGSASGLRVFRGGCYFNVPRRLRAAFRDRLVPGWSNEGLGFRLCL